MWVAVKYSDNAIVLEYSSIFKDKLTGESVCVPDSLYTEFEKDDKFYLDHDSLYTEFEKDDEFI